MRNLITSLVSGEISLITGIVWLLIAIILSMVSGAMSSMLLFGREVGYELSAIFGSFSAPFAVIPTIIFGLILIQIWLV